MSTNAVEPDEGGLVLRLGAYNQKRGPAFIWYYFPRNEWRDSHLSLLQAVAGGRLNVEAINSKDHERSSDSLR